MRKKTDERIINRCIEMKRNGCTSKEIYNNFYKNETNGKVSYCSFKVYLSKWNKACESTLVDEQLILKEFDDVKDGVVFDKDFALSHPSTIQYDAEGNFIQAWTRYAPNNFTPENFIEALKGNVETFKPKPLDGKGSNMLEIPLFDMHWGIADLDYYLPKLFDILDVISSRHWAKIVIPFGQDFFHNDSIVSAITSSGREIAPVDMKKAVKECKEFIYSIIDAALNNADEVHVFYSPGNHDRSISWMFMQVLLERYGEDVVEDSLEFRKIITYGQNAIMVTHGESKRSNRPDNLAHIFPTSFPLEFATTQNHEVHCGHLHHETDTDIFGIMVRRLASANKIDEWSDMNDFINTNRRFMLFDWSLEKLHAIYYI